jgi:transcriptional regulator with XRE-family HTH domain
VQDRIATVRAAYGGATGRPPGRAPEVYSPYLLSGLTRSGICGGRISIADLTRGPLLRVGHSPNPPRSRSRRSVAGCYYMACDRLSDAMTELRTARQSRGWTQARAAARLGVSQPYLAMLEAGQRPLTPAVARRAMRVYGLAPTVLPPAAPAARATAETLAQDLAALGYPGFAHLARRGGVAKHPGAVLLTALAQLELEARVVEALPWVLLRYWTLDRDWLVREAKLRDLQNRLGFVVRLAREVAEPEGDRPRLAGLRALEAALDQSRLAREDTLGRAGLSEAERRRLEPRRSAAARHWNLLTDWTAEALRYRT